MEASLLPNTKQSWVCQTDLKLGTVVQSLLSQLSGDKSRRVSHPQLHIEFEASLSYIVRLCLKNKDTKPKRIANPD